MTLNEMNSQVKYIYIALFTI